MKTKSLFTLLLFLAFSQLLSQSEFSKLKHNFGDIKQGNKRFVDITYKNTSSKKVFLLTIKNNREVRVLTSGKTILPDSSIILRFKYNPKKKGKFKIKTPVYFSNSIEPYVFIMSGNVKEIDNSFGIECPGFGTKDLVKEQSFDLVAIVLDKKTNLPINDASIKLIKNGYVAKTLKTNKKGLAKPKIPLGLYYTVTSAEGYFTDEQSIYLNRRHDSLIVYLSKPVRETPILANEPVIDTVIIEDTLITVIKETPPVVIENTSTEIKEVYYAPSNIVFLLDLSSSMNQKGKLDLLKASMIEMTKELRAVDKITIVAYATFSKVLLPATTGDKKEEIIEMIQDLKANGMTAGGAGMKLAYRQAKRSFIDDGNNQVIMATDGDFNRGANNIDRLVKKNTRKGIKISVLGIKNKETHATDMKEISELGKGHYLFIDNYDISKRILIEELKSQSLRRK